ncbi:MAG: cytochrome c [Chitinophagaceae bacterium]|jgi:nitrite reductase (NO-forming)|nr:cytochrome c [Chitinophagaceae bacterium]
MLWKTLIVCNLVLIALGLTPTPPGPEPQGSNPAFSQAFNLPESIKRGKDLYIAECMSCHMENGEGLPGVYPPVAKTDYVKKPSAHLIDIILKGQEGEVVVNGVTYNTPMPAQAYLDDEKTSDILNYIRNSWGNKGAAITPSDVKKQRDKIK